MAIQANGRSKLRFSIFEVDLAAGEMCKRGVPLLIQEKPFQILALLLERPGEVVTREELQKRLWPDGTFVDFDKGLNTAVKKLRYALGDSPDKPVFIETIPRRGYRFIAPISANGPGTNSAATSVSQPDNYPFRAEFETVVPETQTARPSGVAVSRSWMKSGRILWGTLLLLVAISVVATVGRRWWIFQSRGLEVRNTRVTRVTHNGNVRQMAISPDGRYLAYALRDGLEQSLRIREVGSSTDVQLLAPDTVNFPGMEFSPDGAFVYFVRSEKTNPVFSYLCRMRASGGPVEQLIRDVSPPVSFSPDGKRFVFTRGYPNVTQLRIANADGTNDRLLLSMASHQVFEAGATWSPNDDVVAVPQHVIGEQSHFLLYVVSLGDGRAKVLYSSPGAIGRPLWIRSGKELLVTLEDTSSGRGQLWTISYPDGRASRVTNDLSDYSSSIDLTRDEKTLATMVTSTVSNLWIAQADDLLHPLQATSGEPSLFQVRELSNGRLLALGDGVWTMNKDASDRLPFGEVQDARWIEACGRSVLIAGNKNGTTDLTLFGLDGSNAAALASGDVLFPTCSPDGKFVYYMNFHHPEKIWRKPIDRDPPSAIADVLGSTLFGTLTISPDGRLLAYPYQQYSPPFVALAVIPANGGDPVKTFKVPGAVGRLRWSPDGNTLQYLLTLGGATNLWEQPLNGGKAQQLTSFKTGQIFDFSWSRDRKRLLLTRGQTTRDVVLIEDLDR